MLKRARGLAIVFLIVGHGSLEVVSPHIAYRRDLSVFLVFEKGHNPIEFRTTVAHADVAERNPIICSDNARVGERRGIYGCASGGYGRALL